MEVLSNLSAAWHIFLLNTELDSVALVVKPSTTAEDVQAVSQVLPLSRGGGGVKHKNQILTSSAVL